MSASSSLVFPVSSFAFADPFDCRCKALLARSICLCFSDPLYVIAALAGAERIERRLSFFVLLHCGGEIRRHLRFRLLHFCIAAGCLDSLFVELRSLLDVSNENFFRRK